jgi:acyl-CoA thioester hydrolase
MGASITLRRRLEWADTDAAGYWHHSTFWRYAEAGEAELARSLGLSELLFGATPRRSVTAEFHRPVFFDDEVTITFEVESVGRTSATYLATIDRGGERAATGKMVVVLVDDEGRPSPWPPEVSAALAGE